MKKSKYGAYYSRILREHRLSNRFKDPGRAVLWRTHYKSYHPCTWQVPLCFARYRGGIMLDYKHQ